MWHHWTVRTNAPHTPFRDFETARWVWSIIADNFPDQIAAMLMPNHLHLVLAPSGDDQIVVDRLTGILSAVSRRQNQARLWQPLGRPDEIPDLLYLKRLIRYVALNPCRKSLCADPLEWYWSTYRECIGATVDQADRATRLARLLREPVSNFRVRFHAYVSGDPSVRVEGTPLPRAALPKVEAEEALLTILRAAAAALRVRPENVSRRGPLRKLFIHLAAEQGWRSPARLARVCGTTPGAIHQLLNRPPPDGLSAAQLCLGDARLRFESGE